MSKIKITEKIGIKAYVEVWKRTKNSMGEWSDWGLDEVKSNLIVNQGYQTLVNRLFGFGSLSSTTFDTFAVSNGVAVPAVTNSATTWDADGTQYRKAVESVSYDSSTKTCTLTCFLNSVENTVTSITKFALFDQTGTGGTMFNDVLFTTPKSKNSNTEYYFYYNFVMTQTL